MARALAAAMVKRGFRPRGEIGGHPHLTLLYDRTLVPQAPLEVPLAMEVSCVFLVRSFHGQGRYENQLFTFCS